jgi:hypothetical protein
MARSKKHRKASLISENIKLNFQKLKMVRLPMINEKTNDEKSYIQTSDNQSNGLLLDFCKSMHDPTLSKVSIETVKIFHKNFDRFGK